MQQIGISPKCKYTGISLSDINLGKDVRIAYLIRGGQMEIPNAETILEPDDLVTLVGKSDTLAKLRNDLTPEGSSKRVRIVIFGGTETAIALVRLLTNPIFKIRIIERSAYLCQHLAEQFPHVTLIHGDTTSLRLLEEEQVEDCDFFIACSKDDEDNIMTALQAIHLGAKHTQIVINRPDYEQILNQLKKP